MKTVSVYIPTHNRPVFLERALASLANQDIKDFQVLVCDDGSNKENKKTIKNIISSYRDKFSDLVFFDIEEAKGACHARNIMINAADGEFITGLDDDDEFSTNRLSLFLESEKLEKYAYLSSGLIVNDGKKKAPFIQTKGATSLEKLLFSNVVGNQVFTRTEHLRELGGFDEAFPSWQDYELWIRLTNKIGPGYKVQNSSYTLNIDHELGRITNSKKVKEGYLKFIDKHKGLLKKEHLKSLAVQNLINSSTEPSIRFFLQTIGTKSTYQLLNYWMKHNSPTASILLRKLIRPTKTTPSQ
ncbi:glycosyltransferase [Pseudomonas fluorescens]|uniref:glycosyltransferase n=1 Tax=Pseudomonas fluorescens TaxID=294 RepID=UPI0012421897|nr:glycosyltransferase [Pseudomonas fluorescens]VVN27853.1 hypothetical protein PS639_04631 [Pseudomonas fluorescens]